MRITWLTIVLVLLAGCVYTDTEITVNKDNSIDFRYIKSIRKDVEFGDDTEEMVHNDSLDYSSLNVNVKAWENDRYRGTETTRHLGNVMDLNTFPLVSDTTIIRQPRVVSLHSEPTYDVYTVSYFPKLKYEPGEEDAGDSEEIVEHIQKQFEHKITWKVPFEVVATNAKTRNDSLGVFTWEFKGVTADSIYLQYRVPTTVTEIVKKSPRIIIYILVPIAFLVVLFLLLRKRKVTGSTTKGQKQFDVPGAPDGGLTDQTQTDDQVDPDPDEDEKD